MRDPAKVIEELLIWRKVYLFVFSVYVFPGCFPGIRYTVFCSCKRSVKMLEAYSRGILNSEF